MTSTPLRPHAESIRVELPPVRRRPHRVTKRVVDVVVAALLIVALLPLALITALAVRLDSRGPVLYRQVRAGLDGEAFTMLKFRTMHVDAETRLADLVARNEAGGPLFKLRDDPRITRVGRVLRLYSIDELPQLWNILRGDMSLVGPRPALFREVDHYCDRARQRLLVLPGLTGPWQVGGRSDLPWDDGLDLDLSYVHDWTPATDAVVLARTVRAVIRPVGAY
ncbi:sugar transferase [Frigoribacterium sp. CFBP9039]|uniref:sugar transferase n=1 Tax=Frigoribacterium TaxID=96492 RepID=UPI001FAE2BFC|nr:MULTISPECIES: sugar transferase [Frigoribacterium]MCJ0701084.1 sugar transferase [Frigoribacterium faeni]MDY0891539.1 sugar transferase [Frigoribacterium sp. CFBP9030]MDY0945860.1 sugar transferase [Frigoribacterium sp. CFBP9039]